MEAYERQFYPQFYKSGNFLYFRVVMVGHEFDVSPFQFVIAFFLGNDYKQLQWVDHVQPILREKSLLTTGEKCAIFSQYTLTFVLFTDKIFDMQFYFTVRTLPSR